MEPRLNCQTGEICGPSRRDLRDCGTVTGPRFGMSSEAEEGKKKKKKKKGNGFQYYQVRYQLALEIDNVIGSCPGMNERGWVCVYRGTEVFSGSLPRIILFRCLRPFRTARRGMTVSYR